MQRSKQTSHESKLKFKAIQVGSMVNKCCCAIVANRQCQAIVRPLSNSRHFSPLSMARPTFWPIFINLLGEILRIRPFDPAYSWPESNTARNWNCKHVSIGLVVLPKTALFRNNYFVFVFSVFYFFLWMNFGPLSLDDASRASLGLLRLIKRFVCSSICWDEAGLCSGLVWSGLGHVCIDLEICFSHKNIYLYFLTILQLYQVRGADRKIILLVMFWTCLSYLCFFCCFWAFLCFANFFLYFSPGHWVVKIKTEG